MELERERFAAMDADSNRMRKYVGAAAKWQGEWLRVEARAAGLPLRAAHRIVVESAESCLPKDPFAISS
jgi:argininosuccinate lyase